MSYKSSIYCSLQQADKKPAERKTPSKQTKLSRRDTRARLQVGRLTSLGYS
jgi:hypothetical protein